MPIDSLQPHDPCICAQMRQVDRNDHRKRLLGRQSISDFHGSFLPRIGRHQILKIENPIAFMAVGFLYMLMNTWVIMKLAPVVSKSQNARQVSV